MADNKDISAAIAELTLQQAQIAHSQRRQTDAWQLYERAIAMAPGQQQARHLLGMLHSEMGRFDRAGMVFQEALALKANQPAVWRALSEAQFQTGLTTQAVRSLEQAHHLLPEDAGVLDRLAIFLREDGNEGAALETFEQALRIRPESAQILCNYANLLLRVDRVDHALAAYQSALNNSGSDVATKVVVLTNRAHALAQIGRYEAALGDCDAALQLAPKSFGTLIRRAEVLADQGELVLAIESAQLAVSLVPTSAEAQSALASLLLRDVSRATEALQSGDFAYQRGLASRYANDPDGPGTARMRGRGIAQFKLKHELEQAAYLEAQGLPVPGLQTFLAAARALDNAHVIPNQGTLTSDGIAVQAAVDANDHLRPSEAQLNAMLPFLRTPWRHPADVFAGPCLNPSKDWRIVEQAYLDGKPELVSIDDFLSEPALQWFRAFCLRSRVWQSEYKGKYLGAFAVNGFVSRVHLQLADELRVAMPRIFGAHDLMHLWAFKYDARLGTGINMHADFALVNLNFWITPDEFNLDPTSGGMVVYDAPAPKDWSFHQYNSGGAVITQFLEQQNAKAVTIPYRCNRAVLFNSALFHETDHIAFKDVYEGRRINMTYLFGRQLR